jgi:hypothetical protein
MAAIHPARVIAVRQKFARTREIGNQPSFAERKKPRASGAEWHNYEEEKTNAATSLGQVNLVSSFVQPSHLRRLIFYAQVTLTKTNDLRGR